MYEFNVNSAINSFVVSQSPHTMDAVFYDALEKKLPLMDIGFQNGIFTFKSSDNFSWVDDTMDFADFDNLTQNGKTEGQDTEVSHFGSGEINTNNIQKYESGMKITTEAHSQKNSKEYMKKQLQKHLNHISIKQYHDLWYGVKTDRGTVNEAQLTGGIVDNAQMLIDAHDGSGNPTQITVQLLNELLEGTQELHKSVLQDNTWYVVCKPTFVQTIGDNVKLEKEVIADPYTAGYDVQVYRSAYGTVKFIKDAFAPNDKVFLIHKSALAVATLDVSASANIKKGQSGLVYTRDLANNGDYDIKGIYSHFGLVWGSKNFLLYIDGVSA